MHLGCSIDLAVQGRSSHPVLDSVRWYSGGITAGEAAIYYRSDQSLHDGFAERGEVAHAGSPEQVLSHS
jgi:hypothetical protein